MKARKYLKIMKSNLLTALNYRMNVFMGFIGSAIMLYVFFSLWRVIYAGGGVEGLSFKQMIWYLCITQTVNRGASSNMFGDIKVKIQSGDIAYQLLRPYSFIGFQLSSAFGGAVFSFLSFGVLAVAIGFIMVGPLDGFMLWTLPIVYLSVVFGILIQYACSMALGFTAFKYEENHGVFYIYSSLVLMLGTFIPVEFLPGWLQVIARNLPFSYVTWAPARLFVGFSWELCLSILPRQAFWLVATMGLAVLLYRRGVKNIQVQGG